MILFYFTIYLTFFTIRLQLTFRFTFVFAWKPKSGKTEIITLAMILTGFTDFSNLWRKQNPFTLISLSVFVLTLLR